MLQDDYGSSKCIIQKIIAMASLNRVDLIGRIGKTPDVKTFDNGNKLVTFPLATSESYTDRNGEWREVTEWHNIVLNGKLAEYSQYFLKGSQIYVCGKIRTRSWDDQQTGQKRYQTEIHANTVKFLEQRDSDERQVTQAAAQVHSQQRQQAPQPPAPSAPAPMPPQPGYQPPYGAVAQPPMPDPSKTRQEPPAPLPDGYGDLPF